MCSVQHLMNNLNEVVTVKPTDTIKTLKSRLIKKANIDATLVNAALVIDNNILTGIICEINVATAADNNLVKEWMTPHNVPDKPLTTVTPSVSREKALTLMHDHDFHQLPVVDENNPLMAWGMITLHAAVVGCKAEKPRKPPKRS